MLSSLKSSITKIAFFAIVVSFAFTASAQDRNVKIINETSHNIHHFYASNVGTESWEEDILGVDVLVAGDSVVIDFDDGSGYCKFDFKAVFDDGDELIKEGIDVCTIDTFRYTD